VLTDMDNAILFEPDNAKDLAEKIQHAVSLDCNRLVSQACKDVKFYTWEKRAHNIKGYMQSDHNKQDICVE